MFGSLQRKLIYRPTRQPSLDLNNAGLSPEQARAVEVRTHDGLILNGWHVFAEPPPGATDANDTGQRTIIYFPGNARNREFRGLNCRILAQTGSDVLLFDYRGYAENPGSPSEKHITRDAQSIWGYAAESLGVPSSNIVLYGESLGGAVATRLAAEMCAAENPPGALILGWTFPSLAEAGSYLYPWLPVRWLLVERYASIEQIGKVRCPILKLHGRYDAELPIELGRKLFDAAPPVSDAGIAKRFVELPAGHNDVYRVATDELRAAIAQFLGDAWAVRAPLANHANQNASLVQP